MAWRHPALGWGLRGAHLDASGDVVDYPDGFGVSVAREGMGDEVELHLPRGLRARLLPIDGLAGGALQAAILQAQPGWAPSPCRMPSDPMSTLAHLVAVVVHGHEAQQVVHVPTFAQLAHQLWLDAAVTQDALVARGGDQPLHADGAVLGGARGSPHGGHTRFCAHALPSRHAGSPHPEGSSLSGCSDAPHPLGSCLPWIGVSVRQPPSPPAKPSLPPPASSMGTVTGGGTEEPWAVTSP